MDGFDPRGNIKVLMATNRPDTLDPALLRPGRLDRKVEFGLPDQEGRINIFRIHARSMSVERDIRYELLARLCPNSTGAEIRSVCTEAGMFAIRYLFNHPIQFILMLALLTIIMASSSLKKATVM